SDIATFGQSSQTDVIISTSEEVNSIVFTPNSSSFTLEISPTQSTIGGELIISGSGVDNNSSGVQTFDVGESAQLIFSNTSTAASAHMLIINHELGFGFGFAGRTIFNDASNAGGASIGNGSADEGLSYDIGRTFFNDESSAGHATISN